MAHAASGTEFGGDYHFWNYLIPYPHSLLAFQVAQVVKNPPASAGDAGDLGSIPGAGRPPGGGNGHPLQYSCLGNPMDRGAWRTAVHGVAELDMTEHTHTQPLTFHFFLPQYSGFTHQGVTSTSLKDLTFFFFLINQ